MAPIKQASLDYAAKLKVKDKTQRAIDTGISNLETKLGSRSSASLNDEIADIKTRYAGYSKADKAAAKTGLKEIKTKLKDIAEAEQELRTTRK
jgi:ribosomal protein S11